MGSPPPPMIVTQPFPVSSAKVVAMPFVPFAKASNSKTPIGPFQITAWCMFLVKKIEGRLRKSRWIQRHKIKVIKVDGAIL